MKRLLLASALLAATCIALVPSAKAAEYAGSACQTASNHNNLSLFYSRARNASSTSWLQIDCPMVSGASDSIAVWIQLIDAHTTQNAVCTAAGVLENSGTILGWWSTRNTSGFGSEPQELGFGALPQGISIYHYIGCSLPPAQNGQMSAIVGYSTLLLDW